MSGTFDIPIEEVGGSGNDNIILDDEDTQHDGPYDHGAVLSEMENQKVRTKKWTTNLTILLVSVFFFYKLGFFANGSGFIFNLIIVVLIHEMGHVIGMRLFGYQNVQMFFIPFFGAAVSGQSHNVSPAKKAIISLMGPLPGVILGIVCLVIYGKTLNPFYFQLCVMFLCINIFNLLPFYPLDGGRFLHEVIFSRNRYLEISFRVLAGLALVGTGLLLQSWVLVVFPVISMLTLRFDYKLGTIASKIKRSRSLKAAPDAIVPMHEEEDTDDNQLPVYREIIDKITDTFGGQLEVKTIAIYTKGVWERFHRRPPGILATFGLLGLYIFTSIILPVAASFATATIYAVEHELVYTKEIVEFARDDGTSGQKEMMYLSERLVCEREFIDGDVHLYHGKATYYHTDGQVSSEGTYSNGRVDGEWKAYDEEGYLIRISVYDKDNFVSWKKLEDGQWVYKQLKDIPLARQNRIAKRTREAPRGPGRKPN